MYANIGADTQITGTALGYIYRTDNLMATLVNPAKDGRGDWKLTRSSISRFFDDMERDLQQATYAPNQLVPAERFYGLGVGFESPAVLLLLQHGQDVQIY